MMTITENYGPNIENFPYVMMLKGAPEKILDMCTLTYKDG
jgi:magnesium-transporting ATPase (P-type)